MRASACRCSNVAVTWPLHRSRPPPRRYTRHHQVPGSCGPRMSQAVALSWRTDSAPSLPFRSTVACAHTFDRSPSLHGAWRREGRGSLDPLCLDGPATLSTGATRGVRRRGTLAWALDMKRHVLSIDTIQPTTMPTCITALPLSLFLPLFLSFSLSFSLSCSLFACPSLPPSTPRPPTDRPRCPLATPPSPHRLPPASPEHHVTPPDLGPHLRTGKGEFTTPAPYGAACSPCPRRSPAPAPAAAVPQPGPLNNPALSLTGSPACRRPPSLCPARAQSHAAPSRCQAFRSTNEGAPIPPNPQLKRPSRRLRSERVGAGLSRDSARPPADWRPESGRLAAGARAGCRSYLEDDRPWTGA